MMLIEPVYTEMLFLLTDSMAAKQTLLNLSRGEPPRPEIERRIKEMCRSRDHMDTCIPWIRSHIGIPGNEKADRLAQFTSILGRVRGDQETATEGAKSQGQRIQKKPAGGRRLRQRYRPTLVQKGPLGLHMDENEPGTTTFLVTLRRKGTLPTVPVRTSLTGRRHVVFECVIHQRETRAHSVSTKLG